MVGGGIDDLQPMTAPALIVVGSLMAANVRKIDWSDLTESFPAFLVVIGVIAGVPGGTSLNSLPQRPPPCQEQAPRKRAPVSSSVEAISKAVGWHTQILCLLAMIAGKCDRSLVKSGESLARY